MKIGNDNFIYRLTDTYFNGVDNYVDTGVKIWSDELRNANWEIKCSFKLISTERTENYFTSQSENSSDGYPGISFRRSFGRLQMTYGSSNVEFNRTVEADDEICIVVNKNNSDYNVQLSINGIETNHVFSYTSPANNKNFSVLVGAAKNNDGTIFRFSNILLREFYIKLI